MMMLAMKEQSLMAKDDSDLDNEEVLALMANLDLDVEDDQIEVKFFDIKEKI